MAELTDEQIDLLALKYLGPADEPRDLFNAREMIREAIALSATDADMRKKAARYDFLRSSPWDWQIEHLRNGWATYYAGSALDDAIDAARSLKESP